MVHCINYFAAISNRFLNFYFALSSFFFTIFLLVICEIYEFVFIFLLKFSLKMKEHVFRNIYIFTTAFFYISSEILKSSLTPSF